MRPYSPDCTATADTGDALDYNKHFRMDQRNLAKLSAPEKSQQIELDPLKTLKRVSSMSENVDDDDPNVNGPKTFPAWIYCTRYSDRPSCSGKKRILLGFTKQLNFCIAPIVKHEEGAPKVWETCF